MKAVKLHPTYSYGVYYVNFTDLPKAAQNKLLKAEVEVENSRYTVYESTAFIRAEIKVNEEWFDAEISLGSCDIQHSDYTYSDELDAYVDDDGREVDSDAYAEDTAKAIWDCSDLVGLTVYLDRIGE